MTAEFVRFVEKKKLKYLEIRSLITITSKKATVFFHSLLVFSKDR